MNPKRLLLLTLLITAWVLYALLSKGEPTGPGTADGDHPNTPRTATVADTAHKSLPPIAVVTGPDTAKQHRTGPKPAEPAEKRMPAACVLAGITFNQHAPGRDKLTFAGSSAGHVQVSGRINSMSVSGSFRVSGTSLTAVPKAGSNILRGTLSLENGCAKLVGDITVQSAATGKPVNLPVDLFDPMKGG
jgi:hypothetical protein